MSTALYRRYRPESFADVIGQEHVTEPLMQALRTGRVNHAYLFSGPRGCGKTTSARILARCLNCEQGPTPIPCGVCDSCVALARGGSGSIDVIEIDAASHGGVEDARDLRERASYGPALSRYKVYIIDEAHMVTTQGFNALLKIVEEPPEHVKFIFATTEPDKVIGTIRSRTHHYPFRLVPPLPLHDYLGEICASEKVSVAPGVLSFVIRAGGGSVRDSLSVLDQLIAGSGDEGLTYESAAALLGFTDGELLDATIDGFAAGDAASVFRQVDKVIETGHDPRRFVEDLLERLRDLIVVAAVPEGASSVLRGIPEDQLERMLQQSAAFGSGALSRSADIVNAGLTEMTGATAPRLQLELICARLLLPGASGESGYAARLDRLERRLEMTGTSTSTSPAVAAASTSVAACPQASQPPCRRKRPVTPVGRPEPVNEVAARPQGLRPAERQRVPSKESPARSTQSSTQRPAVESPPVETRRLAPMPGGIDTDAIRRSWPDVLAKIATISGSPGASSRRTPESSTTTANASSWVCRPTVCCQPCADAITPRSSVRRSSRSSAWTRTVEGVLSTDAASTTRHPIDPVSAGPASTDAPSAHAPSADAQAMTTGTPRPHPGARPALRYLARRTHPTPAGANRHPGPALNTEAASQSSRSPRSEQTEDECCRRSPTTAWSAPDDEDIEEAGDMGQPVIERVLGGMVIGELDQ